MIINKPTMTESGTTMYGYHSSFEVLRVDNDKAKIVALDLDPTELRVGDAVFYGITGSFWEVEAIEKINNNVIDAKVKRFQICL